MKKMLKSKMKDLPEAEQDKMIQAIEKNQTFSKYRHRSSGENERKGSDDRHYGSDAKASRGMKSYELKSLGLSFAKRA